MTYKNTKFNESPVMRSFEKLAVKKGLVKPDEIKKTASKKSLDLTPGPNFEENILKLCAGLRDGGFTKQAVEVETKFFNLKKAVHLYDTHGETGDDVVGAAHPDGSHQMKGIDGDAMIETILDKHTAMKNMIAKEPNGKLATAKKLAGMVKSAGKINNNLAINAVKLALGQLAETNPTDNTSNTASNVTTDAAVAGGLFGSAAFIKWLYTKLLSSPNSPVKELIKDAEQYVGRKLTQNEINILTQDSLKSFLKNKLEKEVGKDAVQAIEKNVIQQVAKTGVEEATETTGSSLIGKQLVSKILNLGKGAAAATGEVAGVGAATSIAAIVGAAIVGGLLGNKLFKDQFMQSGLDKAGQALLDEVNSMKENLSQKQIVAGARLERYLSAALESGKKASELDSDNPPPDALPAIGDYIDNLGACRDAAYTLYLTARESHDKNESFLSNVWTHSFASMEASATNFMKIVDNKTAIARDTLNQIASVVQKNTAQTQKTTSGGEKAATLLQQYDSTLQLIDQYIAKIKSNRAPNAGNLIGYLTNKVKPYITKEKEEFSQIDTAQKEVSADAYAKRLDAAKNTLSEFAKSAGV